MGKVENVYYGLGCCILGTVYEEMRNRERGIANDTISSWLSIEVIAVGQCDIVNPKTRY